MVKWPDRYEWCSFAAACKGDGRCISGYRFIYTFAPVTWEQIREMHEKSIHLVLKELEDEKLAGPAKKGLSVDEEKSQKVRQREFDRFASRFPNAFRVSWRRAATRSPSTCSGSSPTD